MYKLVIIAGPHRGTTYAVQEGEVSIGRQTGNTIVLQSSKISKRHCVLVVSGSQITLQDEGSSNGTFVNGVLAKNRKVKPGDRISMGEYVFELKEASLKAGVAAPALDGLGNRIELPGVGADLLPIASRGGVNHPSINANPNSALNSNLNGISPAEPIATSLNQPPKDIKGKLIWYFENRLMPVLYEANIKYEWRMICVGLLGVFMVGNLVISVYPLLESSRNTLVRETGRRAKFMAREIAEHNEPFIAQQMETKTEIGSVENADAVRLALLVDLNNRIIAPGSRLNQYLTTGPEAITAVKAANLFRAGRETGFWEEADENTIVGIEPVKVLNPTLGKNVTVAMAVVSVDLTVLTPDMGDIGVIYSQTLIFTGILGGLIFIILYRLTLKPFHVLNEDMDKALKGDLSQVTHEFKLSELNPLWEIINSAIQRIPRAGTVGSSNSDSSSLQNKLENYEGPLKMLGSLVQFGFVLLDVDKKVTFLNSMFEEISGIRADSAIGQDLADVARDQAMVAFTNDILNRAPVGGEGIHEDFDFSGISYKIHAAAFGSPGGGAHCYILIAVRSES